MRYYHVDVFSDEPLGGNGLTVVFPESEIGDTALQGLAREFKQFETSFIYPESGGAFPVRIFTVDEELPFAGHPVLGSAAMIHHVFHADLDTASISVSLGTRTVALSSVRRQREGASHRYYSVTMNQGKPDFISGVSAAHAQEIAAALALDAADLDPAYPIEVVSTGLPYLLVPLRSGLGRAKISRDDFEKFLSRFGAKFVYLFDTASLECRTWDNSGAVEDTATGSAAGSLCAYLVKNGFRREGETVMLSQGRFALRPARIACRFENGEVSIRGDVALFARGELFV